MYLQGKQQTLSLPYRLAGAQSPSRSLSRHSSIAKSLWRVAFRLQRDGAEPHATTPFNINCDEHSLNFSDQVLRQPLNLNLIPGTLNSKLQSCKPERKPSRQPMLKSVWDISAKGKPKPFVATPNPHPRPLTPKPESLNHKSCKP